MSASPNPTVKLVMALHHPFELWRAPGWFAPRLRRDFPQLQVVDCEDYERLGADLADADILLGWSLRPEQFAAASKLRWVHSTAAAVHQLLIPELAASSVLVTNAREVHGPVVAEHALALMLALAKRLPSALRWQRERRWAQQEIYGEHPGELLGATLLLVGFGSIGRELAGRAHALGMRVLAVRQHPQSAGENVEKVFAASDLLSALPAADFTVLAAPLTAATHHLINAAALAAMKPSAFLINVSRGPLIDDAALVAALLARQIAGAALDVFEREPLPADSPYWTLENCLVTPHTAAVTEKLWERHYTLLAENLRRFLGGQPLRGVVDKQRGY